MSRRIRRGISCPVLLFPPAPPVTVTLDGRRLVSYVPARVIGGRVYAPLSLVRMLVDRVWLDDGALLVERGGRRARVPLTLQFAGGMDTSSVALGELVRALGETATYRSRTRTLDVRTPRPSAVSSASPFNGAPQPARSVFTPQPVPTPRPTWGGSPLPRRTPLTAPPPAARRSGRW